MSFKVTAYPHGTLSWADSTSTDQAKVKPFYAALFGWEIEDAPMGSDQFYTMYHIDGNYTAGLGTMPQEMQQASIPSHWINYISVDDVDSLVGKVTELGGKVIAGPFDVFENGRMMSIQDPTGAMVSLWQPKSHIGAGIVNTNGAMCWNELATRDLAAAQKFYGELLGWTFGEDGETGYHYIKNNGRMNGGMMEMDDTWGDVPPNWMVYFSVPDIEATVKKAEELGGKVHVPPTDAGSTGRFSVIADPTGAVFTAMQLNQVDTWK